MSKPRFEYGSCEVNDLSVVTRTIDAGNGKTKEIEDLYLDGREVKDSPRFWTSLQSNFGFSSNIFKYFSHSEVFNRIADVSPRSRLNWCIESAEGKADKILAVTNPGKAVLRHDDALDLISKYGGSDKYEYSNGIIQSQHFPIGNDHSFSIGGDAFENRFALDIPIDGFGNPSTYLMMMRLRCTNGMIAMTPAFRSEINIGRKEGTFALSRVLEGYNNEDGFLALRDRYTSAQTSFASLNEVNNTYKTLLRVGNSGGVRLASDGVSLMETAPENSILGRFNRMTGDIGEMYGLANYDAMSQKKQRTLPAKCTMYDLFNFITEIATHKATTDGARRLQALQGDMLANEYDLEGTCTDNKDYRTFWMTDAEAMETKASLSLAS